MTWLRGRAAKVLACLVAAAIATAVAAGGGARGPLSGLSVDLLFKLRDLAVGPRRDATQSPIAVVLIDEATYAAPEFRFRPKEMWTPELGAVLSAIDAAGPRAIGFDIILPTTLGALQADFDAPFLRALRGARDRLVLAKFQGAGEPIAPYPAYVIMAGGDAHVRSTNLGEDSDGIVRSLPLLIPSEQPGQPPEFSFAADLARRGGAEELAARGAAIRLNFDGGTPFPAYSFADLYACARAGGAAFFTAHFRDRIVLIGSGLDAEDRRLTARRFINPPEGANGDRCAPLPPGRRASFARPTLPGVYVQATAIDNLLRGEALRPLPPAGRLAWVAVSALLAATLATVLPIWLGAAAMLLLLPGLAAAATAVFVDAVQAPMLESVLAAALGFLLALAARLTVTERDRRLIRRMFGLYLAPDVIARMLAAGRLPALGGERRELSFLFTDIAGFTTLTEAADPTRLAPILNAYFDGVFEAVMRHGGLVIEFVGDGVQAVFGAPAEQPDHAARALACARAADAFGERFRATGEAAALGLGHTRIGVHTGAALVGNFGGTRRFKYAALGDAANATSRIEGLNKFFGTRICVSDAVLRAAGDSDARPVGEFLVKGRRQWLRIHELLAPGAAASESVRAYTEAFQRLEARDAAALNLFRTLAMADPADGCVRFHLDRLERGIDEPLVVMDEK